MDKCSLNRACFKVKTGGRRVRVVDDRVRVAVPDADLDLAAKVERDGAEEAQSQHGAGLQRQWSARVQQWRRAAQGAGPLRRRARPHVAHQLRLAGEEDQRPQLHAAQRHLCRRTTSEGACSHPSKTLRGQKWHNLILARILW